MARNVPIRLQDRTLFSIGEALARAGLSRSTYFRWVRSGRIPDTQFKDRNGRRVFTEEEVDLLNNIANQLRETETQTRLEFGPSKI
jgi:DNA-binding transcriptional MerR regulator